MDSIGYTDPSQRPDQAIELDDIIRASNHVVSQRIQAHFQDSWSRESARGGRWDFNAGVRGHYWTFNQQLVGGPRARLAYVAQ